MVDVAVAEVPQTNPLNDLLQADRDDAWAYFDRLAGIYARELRRLTRQAEARFHRHQWSAPLTAAGQPADWHIPDPDELIDATKAAGDLAGATRKVREEIAQASVGGTLAAYGLAFDLRNPVIQNVLTQMGQHITSIVEEQRRQIMASLQASWENGLSIRDAAKAMVADSVIDTQRRGELIARTELTGATNGGSLAAVRLVNDASPTETQLRKIWIATNDERTRESHSEADATYGSGNGIPVNEAFIVGGAEMQHPGDPSGPPEECINCRCTIGYEQTGGVAPAPEPVVEAPPAEPGDSTVGGINLPPGLSVSKPFQFGDEQMISLRGPGGVTDSDLHGLHPGEPRHGELGNVSYQERRPRVKGSKGDIHIGTLVVNTAQRGKGYSQDLLRALTDQYPPSEYTYESDLVSAGGESAVRSAVRDDILPPGRFRKTGESYQGHDVVNYRSTKLAPEPVPAPRTPAELSHELIASARSAEPQVTNDLQSIVRANGGTMGGLEFRLKTETSLSGKLARKAAEKGITPEAYSKSVADVLRYTGVFEPADYATGVGRTITRLRKAGYKIDDSDIENYWSTGDDYNGINMTLRTQSGYRFELQFHTPESMALKNGPLHKLYEQFRDETNAHERVRLWKQMVGLSNSIDQPAEDVLKIGTRTIHKPPELPTTPEDLATSLLDAAKGREPHVTSDLSDLVTANGGKLVGLDFRLKTHDSIVRKLTAKGPLDPVAYSLQIADVLRYTATFTPDKYARGVEDVISTLRSEGYRIDDADVENYWQTGDDYNGININLTTPGGYRFELQFHTPESFQLKNGELHRIYSEYRSSTDPFIRRELWNQMVELSDQLIYDIPGAKWEPMLRIGTPAAHEAPVAIGLDAINAATGALDAAKYLRSGTDAWDAVMAYTRGGYDRMNEYLRHFTVGDVPAADLAPDGIRAQALATTLREIALIRDAFTPSDKAFIVYRGYKKAVLDAHSTRSDLTDLIGKTIEDPGFVSTTAVRREAESFAQHGVGPANRIPEDQVVMELAVPKGSPTLNISRIENYDNTAEQEIILPPATRFRVISVRRDDQGRYVVRAVVENG